MQLSLLDTEEIEFDPALPRLQRTILDDEAWIDYCPQWLQGQRRLFDELVAALRWHHGRRRMYERMVDVPRLTAALPRDGVAHPALVRVADCLGDRYGVEFRSISFALYRDGRDSVAWHRDRDLKEAPEGLVCIVSLGEPRTFMLRPFGGGRSRSFPVGWGDLLVMGGACQRTWEHCVPKARAAGPRMSVMFRERGFLRQHWRDAAPVSESLSA